MFKVEKQHKAWYLLTCLEEDQEIFKVLPMM